MRSRSLLLALLLLLLATPLASACSYAGELPPEPAAFVLRDLESHDAVRLDVVGRALGGGCELSNPHSFRDGVFAYVGIGPTERSATLHVHDVVSDIHLGSFPIPERFPDMVSVSDGLALYHARVYEPQRAERFVALDVATGERRELPFPSFLRWSGMLLAGAHAYARDDAGRLWAYDALTQAWLVEGQRIPDAPHDAYFAAADEGKLLLTDDAALYLVDVPSLTVTRIEHRPEHAGFPFALDDGWLYLDAGRQGFVRAPLDAPDEREPVPATLGTLVSIHDGWLVEGYFSEPPQTVEGLALRTIAPASVPEAPAPRLPLPLAPLGLLVLACAGLAAGLRVSLGEGFRRGGT